MAAQEGNQEREDLEAQLRHAESEVVELRKRLHDAPDRVSQLEESLLETRGLLSQASSRNEKLSLALQQMREQIAMLRDEVDKLSAPPSQYGIFVGLNADGTADIISAGRKFRVQLHPDLDPGQLRKGDEVVVNDSQNVILAQSTSAGGQIVTYKETLDDGRRAIVFG